MRSPASAAVTSVPVMPMALAGAGGARRRGVPGAWPLLVVLAVQAGLSLRLLRADTASQSEALYLHAGHLEWAHWLHGVPIPPFPAYLSGAPVLYPPIGGSGGQHRRAGRCPGSVPGVHARRHCPAVGCCGPAVRPAGRVLRGRIVRRARHDLAPGGVRHLRRDVGVPGRAGGLVRNPRRGPGTGDRVDGRGGGRPGAGQRHGLHLFAVRPAHRRARPAYRTLDRPRLGRGPARRDRAGRHGRAAGRRTVGRREQLPELVFSGRC